MIPATVIWSYGAFALVCVAGLVALFVRHDWQNARGLDRLILFGPIFYGAPIAAFGVEHFTLNAAIASLVPKFIPWHRFVAYFIGACFVAAAFSLVTKIADRLAGGLLALTFFLFVALMDAPAFFRHPENRFALTFALRELSFCAGPLALAVSLRRNRAEEVLAIVARLIIAVTVLFYSFEQFLHADHVAGIPLEPLTPAYVAGHAVWTYVAAAGYAIAGSLLLFGWRQRVAAAWVGATVLFVEIVEYVPIGIVERASLDNGLNYAADTLMFCGTVLLLAGAMRATLPAGSRRPPWYRLTNQFR